MQVNNVNRSNDGRKLLLSLEINEYKFKVANIYAPNYNQNRIDFFKKLLSFINKHKESENVLRCGDFNCRLDNELDKSLRFLNNLIKQLDIYDVWKTMYPDIKGLHDVMQGMFLHVQTESSMYLLVIISNNVVPR